MYLYNNFSCRLLLEIIYFVIYYFSYLVTNVVQTQNPTHTSNLSPIDKILVPIGNRIVCKPYEKNPYRKPLRETTSGLILGDFESSALFKSNETGEEEAAQRGIWCCEVLYVGSECKTVEVGDDVYINFPMAAPVPFGGQGYYSIGEPNIICVIRKK